MAVTADALAEPTERVRARWVGFFSLAVVGLFVGWYGPLQILLANQSEAIAPESKESVLALTAGIGAAFSLVANPLWGAWSDRTASRLGRRLPFVLVGAVGGAASLLLLGSASSVLALVAGWCLAQTVLNAPFAALSASVPDQVPVAQRGAAGGFFGLSQILGVVAGTGLAVGGIAVLGGNFGGYLACAVVVLLAPLPFVLMRRDRVLRPDQRPPWSWGTFLAGFRLDPRRHPDFAWAWLTRFLMNLGNAIALLYLLFFLRDAVRHPDAEGGVLVLTAVNAVAMLGTVVVSGHWSDRVGRRRVFVCAAGVVMSVAAVLLAAWPTWTGALIAAAVLGIGFGVYTAVDFALLTQVLPRVADRGRDLGVLNIANSLPQVLAPVVAAPIVTTLGGYPTLYATSAAVGLLGAVLVYRIRTVP
ncbi:MAG TPA: MFS transporter [Pseudonocardiaceae bacterium]